MEPVLTMYMQHSGPVTLLLPLAGDVGLCKGCTKTQGLELIAIYDFREL